MSAIPVPLGMPKDLLTEVQSAARRTGLSQADVMRQSIKLGLPKLLENLKPQRPTPMTKAEVKRCYEVPDPEFDALAAHCAGLPKPPPEDD